MTMWYKIPLLILLLCSFQLFLPWSSCLHQWQLLLRSSFLFLNLLHKQMWFYQLLFWNTRLMFLSPTYLLLVFFYINDQAPMHLYSFLLPCLSKQNMCCEMGFVKTIWKEQLLHIYSHLNFLLLLLRNRRWVVLKAKTTWTWEDWSFAVKTIENWSSLFLIINKRIDEYN